MTYSPEESAKLLLANLDAVRKSLEDKNLTDRTILNIGRYILRSNPLSVEQICAATRYSKANVQGVLETEAWYSGVSQMPRNQTIDNLVDLGTAPLDIAKDPEVSLPLEAVKDYLKTRGLEEYLAMKRRTKEKKEKTDFLPKSNTFPTYDLSVTYAPGDQLIFPAFGPGTVISADGRKIKVRFRVGTPNREFVHGFFQDPNNSRKGDIFS